MRPPVLRGDTPEEERIGQRDLGSWTTRLGRVLARAAVAGARWVGANGVLTVTTLLGLGLAALLTQGFGEVWESVVEGDDLASLDRPVLDIAVSWRNPTLDTWVTHLTDLAGPVGMTVVAVVAVALMTWRWRSRTPLLLMVIGVAGSLLMTVVGKQLTGRLRPPQSLAVPPYETSASFPSGHTLNAVVVLGLTAYLVVLRLESARARAGVVAAAVVVTVVVALTRVFLGHHWLTDVVAAYLLGLGWLAVVVTAHRLAITARRAATADAATAHRAP